MSLRAAVLRGDLDMASHLASTCREYILKKHLHSDTWTSVLAGDQRSSSTGSGTVRNRGATPKCQHSCRTAEHKSLITEICSQRPPDSENRAAFDWPLPESSSVTCSPISDVRFTAWGAPGFLSCRLTSTRACVGVFIGFFSPKLKHEKKNK